MPSSLERLLKIRSLLEDSSRAELERRSALSFRIEQIRERERQSALQSRQLVLEAIYENNSATEQAERRSLEWLDAEAAFQREKKLEPIARAAARCVTDSQSEFFELRKERQQVGALLEAARIREQIELEHQAQRALDDWFGMKRIRDYQQKARIYGRKGHSF